LSKLKGEEHVRDRVCKRQDEEEKKRRRAVLYEEDVVEIIRELVH